MATTTLVDDLRNRLKNEAYVIEFQKYNNGDPYNVFDDTFDTVAKNIRNISLRSFAQGSYGFLYEVVFGIRDEETAGKHTACAHPTTINDEFVLSRKFGEVGIGPQIYSDLVLRLHPEGTQCPSDKPGQPAAEGFFVMERFQMDGLQYLSKVNESLTLSNKEKSDRISQLERRILDRYHAMVFFHQFICADAKLENTLVNCDVQLNLKNLVLSDFGGNFCKNSQQADLYAVGEGRTFSQSLLLVSIAAKTWSRTKRTTHLFLTELRGFRLSLVGTKYEKHLAYLCPSNIFYAPFYYMNLALTDRITMPDTLDCRGMLNAFLDAFLAEPLTLKPAPSVHRKKLIDRKLRLHVLD